MHALAYAPRAVRWVQKWGDAASPLSPPLPSPFLLLLFSPALCAQRCGAAGAGTRRLLFLDVPEGCGYLAVALPLPGEEQTPKQTWPRWANRWHQVFRRGVETPGPARRGGYPQPQPTPSRIKPPLFLTDLLKAICFSPPSHLLLPAPVLQQTDTQRGDSPAAAVFSLVPLSPSRCYRVPPGGCGTMGGRAGSRSKAGCHTWAPTVVIDLQSGHWIPHISTPWDIGSRRSWGLFVTPPSLLFSKLLTAGA